MTTDSETMEQYLNFVWTTFLISVPVFVSRDYELGTKSRLIVVYLLRKNPGIEVSVFGNFSTDTGSMDCKHKRGVDRQSRTGFIFTMSDIFYKF